MNQHDEDLSNLTWQQRLAAYADGELCQADRARVETWLRDHPAAADDLDAQSALSPANAAFWSRVEAPAPDTRQWERARENIAAALNPMPTTEPGRRSSRWRFLLAGLVLVPATAAAAIFFAIALGFGKPPAPNQSSPVPDNGEEVFAILEPHEVEIESVRHDDMPLVVVGESPMQDGMTLATYTDVKFDSVQPDSDGTMPEVYSGSTTSMPMVYAPLTRAP